MEKCVTKQDCVASRNVGVLLQKMLQWHTKYMYKIQARRFYRYRYAININGILLMETMLMGIKSQIC